MSVWILLFAAGASSRMGRHDKLTGEIDGLPLLRRSARTAVRSGLPVIALLPPDRPARNAALAGIGLRTETVAEAARGMSASIRAGLAALPPEAAGAMMLMADMPDLTADDLARLARTFTERGGTTVIRAASETGRPGAPAIVPRRLFRALMKLDGDTGGRDVLKPEPQHLVRLPGTRALTDLDTPEDWAAYRQRPA